ncbi:MAG: acylphosphatase [Dokdonella sp.]|uniref:acylphosphatase n=1 Tax=Dokdonella sp. TaxID=2291710 RepID=UPI0032638FA5
MPSLRFLVAGRVQGVFFRASTAQRARALGVTGVARNLDDGRVEVVASGDVDALAALHAWLKQGPPAARVDAVERLDIAAQDHTDFSTR